MNFHGVDNRVYLFFMCAVALSRALPLCAAPSVSAEPVSKNVHKHAKSDKAETHNKEIVPAPNKRTIVCTNKITKEMTGFKRFGTHYPDAFSVSINNVVIEPGKPTNIVIENNVIEFWYHFEFKLAFKNDTKTISLPIDPGTKNISFTFDWNKDPRIIVQQG
jgi:hypothetical protein